jgi:competence protein ComEC
MRFFTKGILLLSLFYGITQAQQVKIYCIDVNTGSSTLIISPTNKYVLIDAGMTYYGNSTVYPLLQNLGITHLDYTIATHYHEDHIGGLDEVIYALSGSGSNDSILGWCYDRGDSSPPTNQIYTGYANAASSKRRVIGLGETLDLGGGAFMFCVVRNCRVMNGTGATPSTGENSRSIGCILRYGLFRCFIGGDLTGNPVSGDPDVETKVAPVVGDVAVYVVNHHGGRNSSNEVFLDSLRPEAAVISQGTIPSNNNHPHQETLDRLAVRNAYIYQMNDNPTGGTIPSGHGRILNTTAIINVNQASYTINGDEYLVPGVHRDGACLEILSPKDTITEATIIIPKARIKNLGNMTESFRVRFRIEPGYNRTKIISGLAPDDTVTVEFDTMSYATRGNYQVICSTEVLGDSNPTNDKQTNSLTVAFYDSELSEIINPANNSTFYLNETLTPTAIVKDNSEFALPESIKVFCIIHICHIVYYDSIQKISIPGMTDTIRFASIPLINEDEGVYICSVWVTRVNDCLANNNSQSVQFNILNPNGIISDEPLTGLTQNQQFKTISMKLYNISGRLIQTKLIQNPSDKITNLSNNWLSNISPGIYFLHTVAIPLDNISQVLKSSRKILILPHN